MADSGSGKAPPPSASPLLEISEKQRQEDEWRQQLLQLEKEIQTLKSVLSVKCAEASDLRSRLGISSMKEFTEDVKHSYKLFQESEIVQKTNAALKTFGDFASKKYDDLKNSDAVKTLEEKVGSAYMNVKQRISSSNATEGTIPHSDSNLYSPTTTMDHGYEIIEDSALDKKLHEMVTSDDAKKN